MEKATRDYYKVLLTSQTGKGKTFSMKNMDPDTFGLINVENKPLPFKNKFKYHKRPETVKEVFDTMIEYGNNPEIEAMGIDSFSAFTDLVVTEAREKFTGWDVWTDYNAKIYLFLKLLKKLKKEVFVTAHYEILGIEGAPEKRVKVKGKEFEGVIEKEFTIVLFGDSKTDGNNSPEYFFNLRQDGTSSKCPPDIFGTGISKIPNDCKYIYDSIIKFVS